MMSASAPELQIRSPTIFTPAAIVATSVWGLVLFVPVVVSMMVVSVLQFGVLTFLIPLAAIGTATFFLPLGFGNWYVGRLVRPLRPPVDSNEEVYIVQLTREPRSRSGLLALLEDADDIGVLSFTDSTLVFNGDSVQLKVPYDRIAELKLQNAGWRALFAYGARTSFSVTGLPEAGKFNFVERMSLHLPGSRRKAREMYERLHEKVQDSGGPGAGSQSR